jgi:hypothetical protein
MKDLLTCCDEVAMKHGYADLPLAPVFCKEAAELYAKEVAIEAVKLARYINIDGFKWQYTEQEILSKLNL